MPKNLKSTSFAQKAIKSDQKLIEKKTHFGQNLPLDENLLDKFSNGVKIVPDRKKIKQKPVMNITGSEDKPFRPESILEEKFNKVLAERKKRTRAPSPSYDSARRSQVLKGVSGKKPPFDPADFGDDYYEKVRQLASTGLSQKQIAAHLGMHETSWYQTIQKFPELRIAVKQGSARAIEALARNAYRRAMDGDTTLSIFLLKTIGRFTEHWKNNELGDEEPATPSLSITVTDPIEAMQQYEKIMRD